MLRSATSLAALVLIAPAFLTSCASDRGGVDVDRVGDASVDAAAEEVEELDPNDPNVMVCPVTGVMQRIDDETEGHHGGESDRDY